MREAPDTRPEAPDVHDRVPPETAAAWKQGEEWLYLAALADVGLYQRVMALVGTTVDHLRTRACDIPALLTAAARGAGLVDEAAQGKAIGAVGLDHLVADAALALRHRELVAEQVARRRLATLDNARRRGETRVVLEESGNSAGDPFQPYRRLEADVATGRALLVCATPDDEFRHCVHTIEALRVDLETGTVRQLDDGFVEPRVSTDERARERSAARAWEALTGLAHLSDVHHSE